MAVGSGAGADDGALSRYRTFERTEWAALRAATPLPLAEHELGELRGVDDHLSITEVEQAYLPLSRLLSLHVAAVQQLSVATDSFLGRLPRPVPVIIGLAGSVAVGKSTTARVLRALLARWPDHPRVDLVTTDGFLHPNAVLADRGLQARKGFPESYDVRRLLRFLADVKAGLSRVDAPVYSHVRYDVVAGAVQVVDRPHILILEGLNVLQAGDGGRQASRGPFVSDFFDFSIYVDAEEAHIERWYVDRFLTLRRTAFSDPDSYFGHYAGLGDAEALEVARGIWSEVNGRNLAENVLPTRERADLVLVKGADHAVERVLLRRR